MLASLAGSLYAHYLTFISPGSFSIFFSIQLVTMVLIGGMGSLWGAVLGASFLTLLPEVLHVVKEYNVLIYGLILMGVLIFYPQGLFPGIQEMIRKRKTAPDEFSQKSFGVRKGT
jgi:branched-chain amino acid transport system permease protein